MKSQDSVFELVQSLDKQEKRYFRLYAQRHLLNGQSNYLHLFDEISKFSGEHHKELKEKIKHKTVKKNYAETKYQLYNLILKSLDSFHVNSSVDSKLNDLYHQAEILYKKGLYKQAKKSVLKAKEIANHNELFPMILNLLEMERYLVIALFGHEELIHQLDLIMQEKKDAEEKLGNLNEYLRIRDSLYIIHNKIGIVRNKEERKQVDEIMKHPMLKNEKSAVSVKAKYFFHYAWSTYGFMIQDVKTDYDHTKRALEILEKSPHLIPDNINRYLGSLYSFSGAALGMQKDLEFLTTVRKIRSIPIQYPRAVNQSIRVNIFQRSYQAEVDYYIKRSRFSDGISMRRELDEGYKVYEEQLSVSNRLVFCLNMLMLNFGYGDYNTAINWVNEIFRYSKTDTRQDIQAIARMFNLVCHFELGNNLLLPYVVKSTYRFISKRHRLFKVEKVFLKYLRQSTKFFDKRDLLDLFSKMRKELLPLAQDKYERTVFDYFDFIHWLDAKIEGKPYAVLLKERLEKNS